MEIARFAPLPGAAGVGDPYYAALGNGGYQVEHYNIVLDVQPIANVISGTTTIRADATQALSAFNLDFAGLTVDQVVVNDRAADYKRAGRELTITPAQPVAHNHEFTVVVAYAGSPQPILSVVRDTEVGWFHAEDGTINVVGEPDGAATWFPANNHPRDKATYRFEITVPAAFVVAASGFLRTTVDEGENVRYIWAMDKPMASYLAAINIDHYVVETKHGNASTQDFIALAKAVSGQELDAFFQTWLYADKLPPLPAAGRQGVTCLLSDEFPVHNGQVPLSPGPRR